jgi:hypothetical protein
VRLAVLAEWSNTGIWTTNRCLSKGLTNSTLQRVK